MIQTVRRCYCRVVSRKPKPPLVQARWHADEIVQLLYRYWRDRDYRPSEADIRGLLALEEHLFRLSATSSRLIIRLERRFQGEPEHRREQ